MSAVISNSVVFQLGVYVAMLVANIVFWSLIF